jgi:hypothetical protein
MVQGSKSKSPLWLKIASGSGTHHSCRRLLLLTESAAPHDGAKPASCKTLKNKQKCLQLGFLGLPRLSLLQSLAVSQLRLPVGQAGPCRLCFAVLEALLQAKRATNRFPVFECRYSSSLSDHHTHRTQPAAALVISSRSPWVSDNAPLCGQLETANVQLLEYSSITRPTAAEKPLLCVVTCRDVLYVG